MKLFAAYLFSCRRWLLAALLCAGVLIGSFALYRLPLAAVLYALVLCLLILLLFTLAEFFRLRSRCRALERAVRSGEEADIAALPADTPAEIAYRTLAQELADSRQREQAEAGTRFRDMVEYYNVWAHQIKTPIASMKLALENEDSELARRLRAELFRTQQYVEMVMAYLRLGEDAGDYVFRSYDLDALLRPCLRKFSQEFIGRHLTLDYQAPDFQLVTDDKWLSFVVEQLLSNALKYTRRGGISVYLDGEQCLCITDTGIGIAPEELPRIFEKGYTGYNGRTDKSASGLGLYLCSRICRRLGIELGVRSRLGEGTTVFLRLSQCAPRFE